MIKHLITTVFALAAIQLAAQDCRTGFEIMKPGVQLEYTNYDKKDKVESVTTQRVRDVQSSKDTLIAWVDASATDEKGKALYSNTFPIRCHDGTIYMDMRSVVPNAGGNEQSGMQIEFDGTDLVYPKNMKAGDQLPDSDMNLRMSMNGMQLMNSTYHVKNRKVEAEETLTTSAGTFKCLKISYDMEYKLMGQRSMHTEFWYDPAIGMIQTISYDKKGKVESKMVLTGIKKS